MKAAILDINNLAVTFRMRDRAVSAVVDASLRIVDGEGVGLVGESGSGKSTLARALVALLPQRITTIKARSFLVGGSAVDTTGTSLAQLRGGTIAMVFQDPLSYLNPLMTVGAQIAESVRAHDPSANTARRVAELLTLVRLSPDIAQSYPHELSGGMRQRVLIAIALGCKPRLLIADEPTTALDVKTQTEILALLAELRSRLGMAILLISHDLSTIQALCSRIYVMYAGNTIESGTKEAVFQRPRHPYTIGLLRAAKVLRDETGRFATLPGEIGTAPAPTSNGCSFVSRCALATEICRREAPPWLPTDVPHRARCWMATSND